MRRHTFLTLPVLLVAVLALALGSVGTATAGGLTKSAVKKIATKVVNKKSNSLSVAHAATADTATTASTATTAGMATTAGTATNATNLGGSPASAYSKRLFIRVAYTTPTPTTIAGSPGMSSNSESLLGFPLVTFPQAMDNCAIVATTVSGGGTQIIRRSTSYSGTVVQFAIKNDAGADVRADFDVIAIC